MLMGYTELEYETLRAAITSGTKRVEYADKVVEYHSLSAMRALLADMRHELDGAAALPRLQPTQAKNPNRI